jgi:sulfur-carrier protein
MIVRVQLFAAARQWAGRPMVDVEVPHPATVSRLRQALTRQFPDLVSETPHLLFALNRRYAAEHDTIPEDAEVACFPPVSGG